MHACSQLTGQQSWRHRLHSAERQWPEIAVVLVPTDRHMFYSSLRGPACLRQLPKSDPVVSSGPYLPDDPAASPLFIHRTELGMQCSGRQQLCALFGSLKRRVFSLRKLMIAAAVIVLPSSSRNCT
jgi:hypothetical protein